MQHGFGCLFYLRTGKTKIEVKYHHHPLLDNTTKLHYYNMLWSEIPFGMRREAEVQILEKSERKQKSSCKRRKVLHLCEKEEVRDDSSDDEKKNGRIKYGGRVLD